MELRGPAQRSRKPVEGEIVGGPYSGAREIHRRAVIVRETSPSKMS